MSGFASNTPLDDESVDRKRQPQRVLEPPTFETSGRDSYVPPATSAQYSHNPQHQQQRQALQPQRTTSPFPAPPAAAPSSSTEPPPFYFYRKSPQRATSPRTATQHRSPRGFDDSSLHRHGNGQYGGGASTPSRLIGGDSRSTASDARSYNARGTTLGYEGIVSSARHESVSVGAVSPRRFAAPVGFHVESTRQILTRIPPPVDSSRRDGLGRESYPVTSTPPTVERYSVGAPNGSLGPAFDAAMPPRTTAVFREEPTTGLQEPAPGNVVAAAAVPSVAVVQRGATLAPPPPPPPTHRNIAHTTSSPELLMRQSAHSPASPERLNNGDSLVKPPLQRGAAPPDRGYSDNGDVQERGHSPLSPARMSVPRRCTDNAAGYQVDTSSDGVDGDAEAETAPGDVDATDDVAMFAGDQKGNSKAEDGRKAHSSALVESPNAPNEPLGARNRAIVLSPGQPKRSEGEFAAEDFHLDHEPVEADDDVERMKRQQSPDPRSMQKSSVDESDPKRVASISQSVDGADVAKPPAFPLGFTQEEPYVYREPCSFETYVVAALVFASLLVLLICAIGTATHHHFWFIPMLIAGPLLLIGGPYVATLSFRVTLRFNCPENVMHFERSLLGTEHCMWRVTVPLQTVSISRDRGARVALRFGTACECVTVPDGPWEAHLCRLKSEAERWSPVSPNRRALSSGVA